MIYYLLDNIFFQGYKPAGSVINRPLGSGHVIQDYEFADSDPKGI